MQGSAQWSKSSEFKIQVSINFTFIVQCVYFYNNLGSQTNSGKMVMFNWKSSCIWNQCLLPVHCISLCPLSDSHLASGLNTRTCDWMVWKEWGKAGSVSLGKGQGLRPFDNTCQGLAHTPCIFWMRESAASSLQSALICTLGKGLNDQMLDLMQNRHNGSLVSFPPLIWLQLLRSGCRLSKITHFL